LIAPRPQHIRKTHAMPPHVIATGRCPCGRSVDVRITVDLAFSPLPENMGGAAPFFTPMVGVAATVDVAAAAAGAAGSDAAVGVAPGNAATTGIAVDPLRLALPKAASMTGRFAWPKAASGTGAMSGRASRGRSRSRGR